MLYDWFTDLDVKTYIVFGEHIGRSFQDMPLEHLLGIDKNNQKPFTLDILNLDGQPDHYVARISELSRGVHALFQFQDILEVEASLDVPILNRHYCYFESLVYLRESIVSWLDRNVLASLVLLRSFLELSLLHIYWHVSCSRKTYRPYYDWLNCGKGKPSFKKMLSYVFENLPSIDEIDQSRVADLKTRLHSIYKTLCIYNHTPILAESISVKSGGFGEMHLEYFMYYIEFTVLMLHQLLYLYVLTYPMSLFPVNRYKKWGFSGYDGLYFDRTNFAVLSKFIGAKNVSKLRRSLKNNDDVVSLMALFNSQPSLTEKQMNKEWRLFSEEYPSMTAGIHVKHPGQRIAITRAYDRSIRWSSNYMLVEKRANDLSDAVTAELRKKFRDW